MKTAHSLELEKLEAFLRKKGVPSDCYDKFPDYLPARCLDQAKEHLLEALEDGYSYYTKNALIYLLVEAKADPQVFIREYLKASSEHRQGVSRARGYAWALGDALSRRANTSCYDQLVELVKDSRHGRSRQMLPYALARVRSRRDVTIATLVDLLGEREMVLQALDVLGRLKAVEVVDRIVRLTSHTDKYVRKEAEKTLARIRKDPKRFQHIQAMSGDPRSDAPAEFSFNLDTHDLARLLAQLSEAGALPIDAKTAKDFELFAALMELDKVESFRIDPNPEAPIYLLLRCCDVGTLDVDFWSTPEKIAELTEVIYPILEAIEKENLQ